jgi:hypothetical protein
MMAVTLGLGKFVFYIAPTLSTKKFTYYAYTKF